MDSEITLPLEVQFEYAKFSCAVEQASPEQLKELALEGYRLYLLQRAFVLTIMKERLHG